MAAIDPSQPTPDAQRSRLDSDEHVVGREIPRDASLPPIPAPVDPGSDPARPSDSGPSSGHRGRTRGPGRQKIEPVFKAIKTEDRTSAEILELERTAAAIASDTGLELVIGRLLAERQHRPGQELDRFLEPCLSRDLPDKWQMKGLEAACGVIVDAVKSGSKVGICCDYDVDGTTAAAIVSRCLSSLGVESVVLSPDRFRSGYGLNTGMVDKLSREGCEVMIALDFGTSNHAEISHAKERGMKTLVLDHHHVTGEHCGADVFVNPKQDGCGFAEGVLSTAGLAWMLAAGVKEKLSAGKGAKLAALSKGIDLDELSAYAALGLVADVVPLTGANRVIVRHGLQALSVSEDPGLRALKMVSGLSGQIGSADVAFAIGPRINAAGRMARTGKDGMSGAMKVVELLTTEDPESARDLSEELNRYNVDRKRVEKKVRDMAVEHLRRKPRLPSAIVVWGADFHEGVNGIVASRLVEMYHRPTVVLGMGEDGRLKGSVRGIPGLHVVEALEAVSHLLEKYGGHEGAGGLTVRKRKITEFARAFEQECERRLKGVDTTPYVRPDVETSLAELKSAGPKLMEDLEKLEPFGAGNQAPKMLVRGAHVVSAVVQDERHLKLMLRQGNTYMNALLWHQAEHPALKPGMQVDIVCRPSVDKKPAFGAAAKMQLEVIAAQEMKH